jgi:glycosyltransferase involved in cell wall biosynthesis
MSRRPWQNGGERPGPVGHKSSPKVARAPLIILSANSFWNIINFRQSLVNALAAAGYEILLAAPGPDHAWAATRNAKAIGLDIDRSGLNPLADAGLLLQYVRLIRRAKPRVFLGFTAKPNIYGSIAARLAGIPSLPNVSGLGTAFIKDGPLSRIVGLLYRFAFAGCPLVYFQNPDDRDLFIARRMVRPEQARLLPGSGIDLDHFAPAPPAENQQPIFSFIGRLIADKGVREFVEAAKLLGPEHPSWRFRLVGDLDHDNRSAIAPHELREWTGKGIVEHVGHAHDVRPHIAASTVVVLPSYREGLPRSLLEAAAMARPVVASNVPGNRHLVDHEVTGMLCEVRSSSGLAEAMRRIGTMPRGQRLAMGSAARALVEREYDVRLVVSAYLDAIGQLAPIERV